jgi:multidrug efflux pump subunit AcrA (membrane-fusion protein)
MAVTPSAAVNTALDARSLIEQLQQIRRQPSAELDWNRYCDLMRQLCKALHCAVIQRLSEGDSLAQLGRASESPTWSPLQTMPPGIDMLAKASAQGYAQAPAQDPLGQTCLVLVLLLKGLTDHYLILNIPAQERSQLNELTLRALLSADFGPVNAMTGASAPSDLHAMLELAAEVMQQANFDAACLALVNGLAVCWELRQVSFGWVEGENAEVIAISHLDRFERNTSQIQRIEAALLPSVIQGGEVWWPASTESLTDTQPLGDFAQHLGVSQVATLPMRDAQGLTHAVLLLAPGNKAIPDLNELLLALELVQPHLSAMRENAMSLRKRTRRGIRLVSEKLFGPEQTMLKLGGVVLFAVLLYLTFGSWHYRVDASAQLNTDSTRLISAQFDGRIDQVHATSGDLVKAGDLLVSLDTRDLLQQQSELAAEIRKGEGEVNKFRADRLLAETEIAQARLEQSLAKARRVTSYLEQAHGKAPFEGVIVEGEKKDLMGVPVKKGDRIFRLAKVEGLYMTLMVSERDMRHLTPNATGDVALLSHPDVNIPVIISSVIPVAQVKGQDGNQFMVRAELVDAPQAWWRPGMTGLARIDVGSKNIAWILTHRLVDRLRLMLWW